MGKLRAACDLVACREFASGVHMGQLRATRQLAACGKFASCLRVGDPRKLRVGCVRESCRPGAR